MNELLSYSSKETSTIITYCTLVASEKQHDKKMDYVEKLIKIIKEKELKEYQDSVTRY